MGKITKKGTRGYAVNYITRNSALKKLQLTLPEFRKICILKGVYPRNPKKKVKGKDKTYYYKKDIIFLMHDPLIKKFREHRAWKKKVKKAKAKNEKNSVESLMENKPSYSLNHLIKERYPTFLDAVRDLDDALCMIFLFANMPSSKKIHQWRIEKCQRLSLEFQYYIIKTFSLRKVFISIKGIYYQAEIFGELVTWIVPFKYTQKISKNVDYKVMLSFLEFNEVLLSFINFKLYHSLGMTYPPVFDTVKFENGEYLSALNSISLTDSNANGQPNIVEDVKKSIATELDKTKNFELKKKSKERIKSLSKALVGVDEGSSEEDKEVVENESVKEPQNEENETLDDFGDEQTKKLLLDQKFYTGLFKECVFWISREVPKDSLEFIIKSFGGKALWDGEGSVIKNEEDESITHHIVDRGTIPKNKIMSRDYVQPQFVYDCVNAKVLLPVDKYAPGVKLPPHLSPFVDYEKEMYIPDYKKELDYYYKKSIGEKVDYFLQNENTEKVPEVEEVSEEELDEERYERELKAEKEGSLTVKPTKSKKRKRVEDLTVSEENEQAKTSISLLPRKQRRLLQRIEYGQKTKKGEVDKKVLKKQKLNSKEAFINNGIIQYTNNKE